jgi:arylsulfatase A-like enzyme
MLVTDHPHLFETGGENYHTDFQAWEYLRGHEGDPWKTRADPSWVGAPALPAAKGRGHPYDLSRTWFKEELDFPGPRTMSTAAKWLSDNANSHERFMLFIDEFDPHEPFDTPAPWANRYDPDWKDELIIWPPYAVDAVARGVVTQRQAHHVRANYGAKLSMIDHWFGRLLDVVDANALWENTAIVVCTDHGHYLGEKDIFGKPGVPHYEPLGHTPLMIAWPGQSHRRCDALTTNVDIHATIADVFGVASPHQTHGHSMVPLVTGEAQRIREWALAGVYGRWVHLMDGKRKYARAPAHASNLPLSMWSNRWSTMPIAALPDLKLPRPDRNAFLDYMPGSDVPVIRQPFLPGAALPYWSLGMAAEQHHCYRLDDDPGEQHNLLGGRDEADMIELLRVALQHVEAPTEQLERMGIS